MKTPNVNAKDVLKRLSFLKNNLALLVPIVITVVALLLFIPTRLLSGKLRSTIQQGSVGTGQRVEGMIRRVDEAVRAQQLQGYIQAYEQDANQIEILMKQTTERELLSYDVFPDTNDSFPLLFEGFGRRYLAGVDALLAGMNAGRPPTDSEIQAALESTPRSPYMGRPSMGRSRGRPGGTGLGQQRMSSNMMSDTDRKILDEVCVGKAGSLKVYASPVDVGGYSYWDDWKFVTRDDAYRDCWYWQLGYWAIEDVATTINKLNERSTSVLDAPVKRLMSVYFTVQRSRGRTRTRFRGSPRRGGRQQREGENPIYVKSDKEAMTTPCTGRYCNEEIDVIQFSVQAVVGANDVMGFMQELCSAKEHKFSGWKGNEPVRTYRHNQITVLETNIGPVEPQSFEHDLYKYGDAPVVELNLTCEYIFNQTAYEDLKPQQVKDDLLGLDE